MSNRRSLIIGGHDAEPGRYPYFTTFDHWGGGVLIAPDIILTVGHCYPPPTQPVKVKVGRYSFSGDDDDETYSIQSIHRHPDYYTMDWDEHVNDYNIFKINGLSKQTPIKINPSPGIPKAGSMVTVIGEGSMSADPNTFQETTSDTLQEVQLKIIPNDDCSEYEDPTRNVTYSNRIFENMMCTTGGKHNQRDGCAFDSGSPLIVEENDEDIVVGMVSWGIGCADPVFPSVNARISSAADWISQTVCDISDADHADLKDFACKPKRGWLYNLFHPRHPNDISSQLTMGIGGDTEGVQMVHHVFFFGIVAVAVAVAVMKMRKFNEGFSARSERQPLKKIVSNNGTETYDSL